MEIVRIDLGNAAHADALVGLLDHYASGAMGNGRPLSNEVKVQLPALLKLQPHYLGWLAFVERQPAGLVNCFQAVSTFRAQPNLNIHDIIVEQRFRRRGIARALLQSVVEEALQLGCCKVTLEVLQGNQAAIAAYRQAGFEPYGLDPAMGCALFFEKKFYGD